MPQSNSGETTHLYLVRHGATDANLQRPYILQGRSIDHSLSDAGRQQAEAVGRFLNRIDLDGVFCSQMKRAVETAETIAGHHRLEAAPLDDLEECDVGDWEGMDWDSIMRRHPDEYRAFIENPAENAYLGGESYGDVLRRVEPVISGLLKRHPGRAIAVVAHNVVNRVYLSKLLGLDLRKAKDIRQENACVNVIRSRNGETELLTLNAYFHLEAAMT